MNFLQPLSAQAQHARKIYTSAASKHDVSTLFGIDYSDPINLDDAKYLDNRFANQDTSATLTEYCYASVFRS